MDVRLTAVPSLPELYRQALFNSLRNRLYRQAVHPGLPEVRHRVSGVKASVPQLDAFQNLLGRPGRDWLPSGYVHGLVFPVAMSVMTRPDFPLPLLGMVHLRNAVEHVRRIHCAEELDVSAWAENLAAHRSGTQVELVTEVFSEGGLVWRGRSTYLAKGVQLTGNSQVESAVPHKDFAVPLPTALWRLDGGIGRAYAAVSGDYNPIHLTALSAKALGARRAMAHGMYLASRMVEEVQPVSAESFEWSIDFHSPVLLPGNVSISVSDTHDDAWTGSEVTGWDARRRRPYFTGRMAPPGKPLERPLENRG